MAAILPADDEKFLRTPRPSSRMRRRGAGGSPGCRRSVVLARSARNHDRTRSCVMPWCGFLGSSISHWIGTEMIAWRATRRTSANAARCDVPRCSKTWSATNRSYRPPGTGYGVAVASCSISWPLASRPGRATRSMTSAPLISGRMFGPSSRAVVMPKRSMRSDASHAAAPRYPCRPRSRHSERQARRILVASWAGSADPTGWRGMTRQACRHPGWPTDQSRATAAGTGVGRDVAPGGPNGRAGAFRLPQRSVSGRSACEESAARPAATARCPPSRC